MGCAFEPRTPLFVLVLFIYMQPPNVYLTDLAQLGNSEFNHRP